MGAYLEKWNCPKCGQIANGVVETGIGVNYVACGCGYYRYDGIDEVRSKNPSNGGNERKEQRMKEKNLEYQVYFENGEHHVNLFGDVFGGMFDCWSFSLTKINQMIEGLQKVQSAVSAVKENKKDGIVKKGKVSFPRL